MKIADKNIRKGLIILIVTSFMIRAFLAFWLEFGNDEVYYTLFARFPDWSHFDHPPMIGWLMQITTLNTLLNHEFFYRLSSLVFMTINTLLIFNIAKSIRNERAGLYAAILYNTSVYSAIITGIFILPDTPQNLLWILTILLVLNVFTSDPDNKQAKRKLLLAGFTIGLGMISKYTSIFLWLSILTYILLFDRRWFRITALYYALLISFLCVIPVLYWNISNDFVSFGFQTGRIVWNGNLRFDYFITELAGGILYNNPVNYILFFVMIIALFRKKFMPEKPYSRLLLLLSLPMIIVFLFFSLFRATLPHWSAPAYNALIILAALWLDSIAVFRNDQKKIPWVLKLSVALIAIIIVFGSLQIKYGILPSKTEPEYHRIGSNDISMDMYGWRELKSTFEKTKNRLVAEGKMKPDCAIIGENWFPLADFDFYVACPLGMKAFAIGSLDKIHKYHWINKVSGGLQLGNDYYYLTTSRDYKHPEQIFPQMFSQIIPSDTITIDRNGSTVKRVFVFLLKDLKVVPNN